MNESRREHAKLKNWNLAKSDQYFLFCPSLLWRTIAPFRRLESVHSFRASGLPVAKSIHIVSLQPNSYVVAARIVVSWHCGRTTAAGRWQGRPKILSDEHDSATRLIMLGTYAQIRVYKYLFGSATCTALVESALILMH